MGADGTGSVSNIIKALDYLTELLNNNSQSTFRLASANLSLAVYASLDPSNMTRQAREPLWRALKALDLKNRTVIAVAAGNEGLEVGVPAPKDIPDDGVSKGDYCFPASFKGLNNMISVAAVSRDLTLAPWSNYSANIAAPGVGIVSTFPQQSASTRPSDNLYKRYKAAQLDDGCWIGTAGGTSMATPHVAGAAALLLSAAPGQTAFQIRGALLAGTKGNVAIASGEGLLNLSCAVTYQTEHKDDLAKESTTEESKAAAEAYEDNEGKEWTLFDELGDLLTGGSGGGGCQALSLGGLSFLLALVPLSLTGIWKRRH